ncbi:Hypothetical predicted protein [Podarcis lilfordi]|uniref:Uncharacterized protein n=1 Tax=Podarcis lilfordi TaxID=74358 RepID=A0AA35P962_9SAUR|nr:Hypothetical predicted protein [Podarcis lilfordi]
MAVGKGAMGFGRCWVWLLAAWQAASVYGAELSSEACRELGFSKSAAKKKPSLKPESSMQGQFLKCVDENWGGSLKFRLSSGVTSPNCSGDCRSSTYVVRTPY